MAIVDRLKWREAALLVKKAYSLPRQPSPLVGRITICAEGILVELPRVIPDNEVF
jgi:hypothetical protein